MNGNQTPATWKTLKAVCKGIRTVIDDGVHANLERYVARLESICKDHDMRSLYKHLKRYVGPGGR